MAKPDKWLLETGAPFAKYESLIEDPLMREIMEAYERGDDLSKYAPQAARHLDHLTPSTIAPARLSKSDKIHPLKADEFGTIPIPNVNEQSEALAIHLFWAFWNIRKGVVRFDERYGLKTPRAIVAQFNEMKKAYEEDLKVKMKQHVGQNGRLLGLTTTAGY